MFSEELYVLYPSIFFCFTFFALPLLNKAKATWFLVVSSAVRPALESRTSKDLEFCILPFHFHTCGDEIGTTAAGLRVYCMKLFVRTVFREVSCEDRQYI